MSSYKYFKTYQIVKVNGMEVHTSKPEIVGGSNESDAEAEADSPTIEIVSVTEEASMDELAKHFADREKAMSKAERKADELYQNT